MDAKLFQLPIFLFSLDFQVDTLYWNPSTSSFVVQLKNNFFNFVGDSTFFNIGADGGRKSTNMENSDISDSFPTLSNALISNLLFCCLLFKTTESKDLSILIQELPLNLY